MIIPRLGVVAAGILHLVLAACSTEVRGGGEAGSSSGATASTDSGNGGAGGTDPGQGGAGEGGQGGSRTWSECPVSNSGVAEEATRAFLGAPCENGLSCEFFGICDSCVLVCQGGVFVRDGECTEPHPQC